MKEKQKKFVPFGLHLMLDMYDCDPKTLNDQHLVEKILDELPEKLGMRKLIKPYVLFAQANDKKDPGGWSGFVMIQESHISIHTFIKRRFVTIDVYSCKEFDTQFAIQFFQDKFHTQDVESNVETRGNRYPAQNID